MLGIYLFNLSKDNLDTVLKIKNLDFIWVASNNEKYLKVLKEKGIKLYFPIGIVSRTTKYEERFQAINKEGNPIKTNGVCPNNQIIRKRRLNKISRLINSKLGKFYDGIYLDAIRYPTYWEDKNVDYLDTCYCNHCKDLFSKQDKSWEDFRIKQIESFVTEIKKVSANKKLGYFAVPETYEKLTKVFAQQPDVFNKYFNLVSPMIYPQMMGKNLGWVESTLNFFEKYYNKSQVIPIIQTSKIPENSPDKFSYEEAKQLADLTDKHTNRNLGYFALDLVQSRDQVINSFLSERSEK